MLCRPFRACGFERTAFPGRCPGLVCGAPYGAKDSRGDRSLKCCGSCHGIHSGPMLISASTPIPSPTPRRGRDKSASGKARGTTLNNMSAEYAAPALRPISNQGTKKRPHRLTARKIGAVDGCGRLLRSTGGIHSINEMIVPRGN
jgi:hypothetical protein